MQITFIIFVCDIILNAIRPGSTKFKYKLIRMQISLSIDQLIFHLLTIYTYKLLIKAIPPKHL